MTENGKKFLEKLSKDKALQAELQAAQSKALHDLLKAKGLEDEAGKIATEATLKVASAHGVALTAEDLAPDTMTPLDEDELKAVAGGRGYCFCPLAGGGGGDGLACGCGGGGYGSDEGQETVCVCYVVGGGPA